ncbi:MAG: NAD(P)/FAD-dependent oxidoreductase [Burkholderiales bacterium]|nr:NAD(P)/FAD-dependent oxidoreductase [Burkholderiales bacterium]MDE2457318.1 NAD(P)/FAD-dependent oxidoreductase [Burkholderiales bacterium]
MTSEPGFDLLIVGAGFGGLYMLHRARRLGLRALVIDKAGDVGGVWYYNRYPGARCDVESMQYSYSFDEALQQDWKWSERFAAQPEILAYARHVAERFDLRRDIRLNTAVVAAAYDEDAGLWRVRTGQDETLSAHFCVMATGCLSATRRPEFTGLETFRGRTLHTGDWPHEGVDFSGQRVGVIGTGSSGIQAIPMIAGQAAHLTVFQRTPNFSVPARNAPMDEDYERSWKDRYAELRERARIDTTSGTVYDKSTHKALEVDAEERQREYERRWRKGGVNFMHSFTDLMVDEQANRTAAEFVRTQIRLAVSDPVLAERLTPRDHPIGTKRICVDTDYHATFNRSNVRLVDLRESPIETFTPEGLRAGGQHHELDAVVLATGYDAMTGALLRMDITGRAGLKLSEAWRDGPRSYLGLMVAGFPNLFTLTGPGSPSVLSNMIFAIEQHVDWIADCLAWMGTHGRSTIEAEPEAQEEWVAHVNEIAEQTLFPRAASWYLGANVPGKARVFMPYAGGVVPYRRKCEAVAAAGYEGFRLSTAQHRKVEIA